MNKHRNRQLELNEEIAADSSASLTEKTIDKQYHEKLVSHFLDRLNPDQRTVIVLRNVEGLSYQEIADTLKININTVRTRLKRAREALLAVKNEVVDHVM